MASLMRRLEATDYLDLVRIGAEQTDRFWKEAVDDIGIEWYEPYTEVRDSSPGIEWTKWFTGGKLNLVHNCVDKHVRDRPGQVALVSEYEDGATREFTYAELDREVCHLAGAMRDLGVGRGDTVGIFLPMIPEVVFSLLAVAKLGAIFIPLFSGYGPEAIAVRLADAGARLLVTADGFLRRGAVVAMKQTADAAVALAPSVQHQLVVRRAGLEVSWVEGRDRWYENAVAGRPDQVQTEVMGSEDVVVDLHVGHYGQAEGLCPRALRVPGQRGAGHGPLHGFRVG